MSSKHISNLLHLYTIWNPKLEPNTIEQHKNVLAEHGVVKWPILTDGGMGKTLDVKQIERIKRQCIKEPTYLFIQCLNIFWWQLCVGLISDIIPVDNGLIDPSDELLPEYCKDEQSLVVQKKLGVNYYIKLIDMLDVTLDELLNLEAFPSFKSDKFNFPFPCLVRQKELRPYFAESIFKQVKICYDAHPVKNTRCWFVDIPRLDDPPRLGNKQVEILKGFANSKVMSTAKLVKLIGPLTRGKGADNNRVHSDINRLNKVFEEHFYRPIIAKESQSKYILNCDKLVISERG